MAPIIVAAALIQDSGRFLVSQRKSTAHQALKWEFPGGKLENGETPEECLRREVKEELGIEIAVGEIFSVVFHSYNTFDILLQVYRAEISFGKPQALECNDWKWITAKDFPELDMPPADEPVRHKILAEFA